jgi:hypothetical protein
MKRVSCQISEDIAGRVREKARENQQSISGYLRSLVERDIPDVWPEGFFELAGKWEGPLERPEQGEFEIRESFD